LISIPGTPPNLLNPAPGCRFAPRCPFAEERCRAETPALNPLDGDRAAACHFPERAEEFRAVAARNETWEKVGERLGEVVSRPSQQHAEAEGGKVFEVRDLKRHFPVATGFFSNVGKGEERYV